MMTERNGTYVPQRNWTVERSRLNDPARWELSTAERVVLDATEVHIGQQAEGWPTQRRIGLQTGLSERQVRRVVESLVTRGYLAVRVASELPIGEAGRGQRVMYRRGARLEVGAQSGRDDRTRSPGDGHGDRSEVVVGGHDDRTRGRGDRTSRGGPGHDDRTSASFAGHGDRRFADTVSVKGSEIKEISERAGARESREWTERERENSEGATRVLEALGGAGTAEARRAMSPPADPVQATFVSLRSGAGELAPSSRDDSARESSAAVDRYTEFLGQELEP
jgi:hypothetical protein